MKRRKTFLTIEEKRALIYTGKHAPVCMGSSSKKESFITKMRGCIFDGFLDAKRIKL